MNIISQKLASNERGTVMFKKTHPNEKILPQPWSPTNNQESLFLPPSHHYNHFHSYGSPQPPHHYNSLVNNSTSLGNSGYSSQPNNVYCAPNFQHNREHEHRNAYVVEQERQQQIHGKNLQNYYRQNPNLPSSFVYGGGERNQQVYEQSLHYKSYADGQSGNAYYGYPQSMVNPYPYCSPYVQYNTTYPVQYPKRVEVRKVPIVQGSQKVTEKSTALRNDDLDKAKENQDVKIFSSRFKSRRCSIASSSPVPNPLMSEKKISKKSSSPKSGKRRRRNYYYTKGFEVIEGESENSEIEPISEEMQKVYAEQLEELIHDFSWKKDELTAEFKNTLDDGKYLLFEQMRKLFRYPMKDVSEVLGCSVTKINFMSRRIGMGRWLYRKIVALESKLKNLRSALVKQIRERANKLPATEDMKEITWASIKDKLDVLLPVSERTIEHAALISQISQEEKILEATYTKPKQVRVYKKKQE